MRNDRQLSGKDAAILLGLPRTSFYTRFAPPSKTKGAARKGKLPASSDEAKRFSVMELLASDAGLKRRADAASLARAMPDAIVCDNLGVILGIGWEVERLVQQSPASVIGMHIEQLGVPFDPPKRDDVTLHGRVLVADSALRPVILRRQRGGPNVVATDILPERRVQAQDGMNRLTEKMPGSSWRADLFQDHYPNLGFGEVRVGVRVSAIGPKDEGFRVYRLAPPRLTDFLLERTGAQVQLSLVEARSRFRESCKDLAQRLASTLSAEAVTLFLFRRAGESREFDVDERQAKKPKALVTEAHYGFPPILGGSELFLVDEPSLVMHVLAGGRTEIIDFTDEETRGRLRVQHAANFELNSRFRKLGNAIIAPLALPSVYPGGPSRLFGAIRVLNCYRYGGKETDSPGAGESDDGPRLIPALPKGETSAKDPDPWQSAWMKDLVAVVDDVARRLALMYRTLLDAERAEVIARVTALLTEEPSFDVFVFEVVRAARNAFEFDRAVLWQARDGASLRVADATVPRGYFERSLERATASHAMKRGAVLVLADEPELLTANGRTAADRSLHNGFEIPIFDAAGTVWGSLGLYDSWTADAREVDRDDVKRRCVTFAKLIEARVAMLEHPNKTRRSR